MADNNQLAKASDVMTESIRDLLSMKVTVPLGNPAFKYVHTNQFMWIDLPPEFELENFYIVAQAMNSADNRWTSFEQGRWYIEGLTITNDGAKFTMELDVNPFPTSDVKFKENRIQYEQNYVSATEQTSSSSSTVSSTGGNTTLKGGEGAYIDNIVKNIVGSETDALKKAKLVHDYVKTRQHYSSYSCSHYSTAEACYKNITRLNCADMSRLMRAMHSSAGQTCYVVHNNRGVGHFWVVIEINGKKYASDPASTATREFDYFWNPETGRTEKATNGGKYYYNRGKNPSC